MAFRRFSPRRGTFEQYIDNKTGIQDGELVYLTDKAGFAYAGDVVDYQYTYNDYILENVPVNGCMVVEDSNYGVKPSQYEYYTDADYIICNGFYSGNGPTQAQTFFIPNNFNTNIIDKSYHPTGLNKIVFGNINKFRGYWISPAANISHNAEGHGVKKIFFNQTTGVDFDVSTPHLCKNLKGIYAKNNVLLVSGLFSLKNSSGDGSLLELEHLPKIRRINRPNSLCPATSIYGPNYKLKTLTFEDYNSDNYSHTTTNSLNVAGLSGLAKINLHSSLWWDITIRNNSVYIIDLSGTSGYWKDSHNMKVYSNYNLTGFNIPYSGVGYRPTGAADDNPYTCVGGYFWLKNNNISASGFNDFFHKLVDLSDITISNYKKGVALIYVGGNPSTGDAGYNPSIATAKGWTINTSA